MRAVYKVSFNLVPRWRVVIAALNMQQCTQQLSWNPAALGSRLYRASKEIVFQKLIYHKKWKVPPSKKRVMWSGVQQTMLWTQISRRVVFIMKSVLLTEKTYWEKMLCFRNQRWLKKKVSIKRGGLAVRVMASVERFITSWQQVTVRISKLKTILPKSTDLDWQTLAVLKFV